MAVKEESKPGSDMQKKSVRRTGARFDPMVQRFKHVSCEKHRRSSIRESYDKLVELVPGLTEKERRSEWKIYVKSRHYLLWLYARNEHLRQKLVQSRTPLPPYLVIEATRSNPAAASGITNRED